MIEGYLHSSGGNKKLVSDRQKTKTVWNDLLPFNQQNKGSFKANNKIWLQALHEDQNQFQMPRL